MKKITWNWGTGIVLAFVSFMAFILYFVIGSATNYRANHELVTEAYYEQELNYQQEIDAQRNAAALETPLRLVKQAEGRGVSLFFPSTQVAKEITGKVSLYRPSNRQLDSEITIALSDTHLLIPDNRLLGGRWDIRVSWEYKGVNYLHKESIVY